MAFQNQFSPEMESSQHFSEQHLYESSSVLRSILPEQLSTQSTRNGIQPVNHHHQLPTWLDSGVNRQQGQFTGIGDGSGAIAEANFLNIQSNSDSSSAAAEHASSQWLSRAIAHRNVRDDEVSVSRNSIIAAGIMHGPASNFNAVGDSEDYKSTGCHRGGGSGEVAEGGVGGGGSGKEKSEIERYKAEILGHPLYEQLLATHVACLRIATPVDQLPRIDSQLAQTQQVIIQKYSAQIGNGNLNGDRELDQFMTHYVLLLCSFKEQLQQHVRVPAMEAVMGCWEIEQALQSLTGVSPGEGTGATMTDDDEGQVDGNPNLYDGTDGFGFGPLVPTENERSLMECVRHELKYELKQGYKEKIVDIREEILRKRRAGKLPGDTTSVLKAWWQSHAKWPYPTEEDKALLVEETGLHLKQINNWFINQRKRNWHNHSSSSTTLKSKRKK